MANPADDKDSEGRRHRSMVPWLVVALVVVIAAGGFLWMKRDTEPKAVTSASQTSVSSPQDQALEQTKQALSSLQQTVQDLQASQQKLADQIGSVQQNVSAQRGEQKLLSDQLGALSARVDNLVSTKAESQPAAAPQAAPQPAKRTKR
ncbi:hypothetical protein [Bradyrhizobium sp. USDA 4502]